MKIIRLTKAFYNSKPVYVNVDQISFFSVVSHEGHKYTEISLMNGLNVSVKESEGAIMDLIND